MDRYRIIVSSVPSKDNSANEAPGFVARAPEIANCEVSAPSRAEALQRLEEEMEARLENMQNEGTTPPPPIDELDVDGELSLKVSKQLHRDLLFTAREAGVELAPLISEVLARFVAGAPPRFQKRKSRQESRERGRGKRSGAQRQHYHNIMENRADFIEYVRQLDHGEGGRGRGGGRS